MITLKPTTKDNDHYQFIVEGNELNELWKTFLQERIRDLKIVPKEERMNHLCTLFPDALKQGKDGKPLWEKNDLDIEVRDDCDTHFHERYEAFIPFLQGSELIYHTKEWYYMDEGHYERYTFLHHEQEVTVDYTADFKRSGYNTPFGSTYYYQNRPVELDLIACCIGSLLGEFNEEVLRKVERKAREEQGDRAV
ncbi:hypothetical protein IMZ31_23850 (plasmid) [Pontibacillus sp. ALD_SL1]|uniref:hypothetical protein n=1 Tax=Pontibacillus sp. ALD_SL1 TaxID=2777185 RepID=UPI001A962DE6|nr:hypothetical protein [Pontibacillus sp. ALD_SL1]QST02487.1 hypothetical protein IMZ31_23850 [Pontibacillus sp. ALD_SL1]